MAYLHIGGNLCVSEKDLVGFFDLDGKRTSAATAAFLRGAQKRGEVETTNAGEIPRSFLVLRCAKDKKKKNIVLNRILLSPVSTATLKIRARDGIL